MRKPVLLLLLALLLASAAPAQGQPAHAAKGCAKHKVGAKRICLRVRDRCSAALQHDYLKARFSCVGGRLRRASLKALREGEPLLLDAHGRIGLRGALEAFSSRFGRLPGVKVRSGAVGALSDATGVIDAVEAQRAHLTKAQRKAVTAALKPTPHATAAATGQERLAFSKAVGEVERQLYMHGYTLTHPVALDFPSTNTIVGHAGDVLGYAVPGWLDHIAGWGNSCIVSITPKGVDSREEFRREIVAHELFHCVQFEFYNEATKRAQLPQWVVEGSAAWVGAEIAFELNGGATPNGFWGNWLRAPYLDLGKRDYDAIGFYALLAQSGIDVFDRLREIIPAATHGDGSAYAAAIAFAPPAFFDTWGPGFVRIALLGSNWDLTGPGIFGSVPPHIPINEGTNVGRSTDQRGARGATLGLEADVIGIQASVGHGLLHTLDGSEGPLHSELLCTKDGGCTCPDGTDLGARQVSKGLAEIGWQGGGVAISGESLDQACGKSEPPPPPPPPPKVPNTSECRLLKASGIESIVPRGMYAAFGNICTYLRCFKPFVDNGQHKCGLDRGGTMVRRDAPSPAAAKKAIKKFLASGYRRISVGADLAAYQARPDGGVIAMAVGRQLAVVELGAGADKPAPQPTWHNKPQLTSMAKRVAKRL